MGRKRSKAELRRVKATVLQLEPVDDRDWKKIKGKNTDCRRFRGPGRVNCRSAAVRTICTGVFAAKFGSGLL